MNSEQLQNLAHAWIQEEEAIILKKEPRRYGSCPKGQLRTAPFRYIKIVDFQTLIDILKSIFASFNVAVAVEEEKPKTPRRFKLTARVQLPGKLRFVLTVKVSL